jgi:hypothetical protein
MSVSQTSASKRSIKLSLELTASSNTSRMSSSGRSCVAAHAFVHAHSRPASSGADSLNAVMRVFIPGYIGPLSGQFTL